MSVTIQQCDQIIEAAKANAETALVAERLFKNPDFIKIIGDGFLKNHALVTVSRKAEYSNMNEKDQQFLDAQLMGIGVLADYFTSIRVLGHAAEQDIASAQEERAYILEEEREEV